MSAETKALQTSFIQSSNSIENLNQLVDLFSSDLVMSFKTHRILAKNSQFVIVTNLNRVLKNPMLHGENLEF